ncbi:IS630 family transposase [Deinococcus hopiensis]|uniref:IS630 family transposase n=1 Tax=Deinococcus hopiensis TaxID=309885 RepID=UPI00111C52B7|nr:IS630 family transposase [Deinococcus hopiensis]
MKAVGGRGYSLDLRERVVAAVEGGQTRKEVARLYRMRIETVDTYLEKQRLGTLHEVGRSSGRPPRVTPLHEQQLLQQLKAHDDATLIEHARMLEEATGLKVSFKTVDRVFRKHHITRKKTLVAFERSEERRQQFLNDLAPYLTHPEQLVFLDESGFHTAMTRGYARAHRTERAHGYVPRNHGRNQTLICALQLTGPMVPFVLTGAVNGPSFEWYIRHLVCPILQPGQVVVMDNLSSHHRASVPTLIEAQGCRILFLPPYSPDFNPIELMFSQVKAAVRAKACRTVDGLISAIGAALQAVRAQDINAWFRHAYPSVSL